MRSCSRLRIRHACHYAAVASLKICVPRRPVFPATYMIYLNTSVNAGASSASSQLHQCVVVANLRICELEWCALLVHAQPAAMHHGQVSSPAVSRNPNLRALAAGRGAPAGGTGPCGCWNAACSATAWCLSARCMRRVGWTTWSSPFTIPGALPLIAHSLSGEARRWWLHQRPHALAARALALFFLVTPWCP